MAGGMHRHPQAMPAPTIDTIAASVRYATVAGQGMLFVFAGDSSRSRASPALLPVLEEGPELWSVQDTSAISPTTPDLWRKCSMSSHRCLPTTHVASGPPAREPELNSSGRKVTAFWLRGPSRHARQPIQPPSWRRR